MSNKEFGRYEYSIVEVATYLAGKVKGTTDGVMIDEELKRVEWLRWRLQEGWTAESSAYLMTCYEQVVRILGFHALALWDNASDGSR